MLKHESKQRQSSISVVEDLLHAREALPKAHQQFVEELISELHEQAGEDDIEALRWLIEKRLRELRPKEEEVEE